MPKVTYKNASASCEKGQVLREITQKNDWDIPYACENGICGTCIVKVVKGAENLSEMEEQEKMTLSALGVDDGEHRLACQCQVNGDANIES